MPNSGSGDPTDPLSPVGPGRSGALTDIHEVTDSTATTKVGPTRASGDVAPTDAVDGANDPAAIASALASGALDAQGARTQLIDQAVRARIPPDAAPETVAAVRAEVEALLETDPVLAQLLRP